MYVDETEKGKKAKTRKGIEFSEVDTIISKSNIKLKLQRIEDLVEKMGFEKPKLTWGVEIEFTAFSNDIEFVKKKLEQSLKQLQEDGKLEQEDKSTSILPEKARPEELDKHFVPKSITIEGVDHSIGNRGFRTKIEPEFNRGFNISEEFTIDDTTTTPSYVAYAQVELAGYPVSTHGIGKYINAVKKLIIENPEEHDLHRIELRTKYRDSMTNGIHMNSSITALDSNGERVNLLQRKSFADEITGKDDEKFGGELACCIIHARNEMMRKGGMYVMAPVEAAYQRHSSTETVAAREIGFGQRKKLGNFPHVMLRGEGRVSCRVEDEENMKAAGKHDKAKDKGPLRIEDRGPSLESIGDPAYKEFDVMVYEQMELYLDYYLKGMELYNNIKTRRENGEEIAKLTEEDLEKDSSTIFFTKDKAKAAFLESKMFDNNEETVMGGIYNKLELQHMKPEEATGYKNELLQKIRDKLDQQGLNYDTNDIDTIISERTDRMLSRYRAAEIVYHKRMDTHNKFKGHHNMGPLAQLVEEATAVRGSGLSMI